LIWWSILCVATVINVAAWGFSAWMLGHPGARLPADVRAMRWRLLWLSAVYVTGCGFRSVFPMVDVPRICLHDTWISRIVVGRLIATGAELSFTAQWALLLREAGTASGGGLATSIAPPDPQARIGESAAFFAPWAMRLRQIASQAA